MNGKSTPRGLVVLTALAVAFLIGVFVPSDLQANLSSKSGEQDDGSGSLVETHGPGGFPDGSSGGSGGGVGPGTRDADPDWPTPGGWSTDYVLVTHQQQDVRVPVMGPLGQLFDWFLNQVDRKYTEIIYTTVTPRR